MRILLPATSAALGLLLAGCNSPAGYDPAHADFGNAVRQNIAVHTVDPTPSTEPPSDLDGARSGLAVARYRVDKVEKPKDISTSAVKTSAE